MRKILVGIAVTSVAWLMAGVTSGATIPAGTILIVRTHETIRSVDAPGTRFSAQLENSVASNGKTVWRAGTMVAGKVITSRPTYTSTQRLSVDITDVVVAGHNLPIKTTGAVQLDNTNFKTRNDRSVSRGGYAVGAGRVIRFQLAQPVHL